MDKIIWNNNYSVGNELMDNQHKQIIKMINALVDNYDSLNASSDQLHDLFNNMTDYFRVHFKDEEKLLEVINFPDWKTHKKLHLDYIDKTVDLNFDLMLKKDDISNTMMQFLIHWWKNHILIDDMKYKELLSKTKK